MPIPPSGRQHELRYEQQRAVVVEIGGGLRTYATAAGERLDGYEIGEMCSGGRGQPLIPWPNRVRDGRYAFDGREFQLALTEPEAGNAIHGLVRWVAWEAAEIEADRVVMTHRLHPQPGWPGVLDLRIEYRLDAAGLTVSTEATNAGAVACPYGVGFHPYLTLGTERVDDLVLELPARRYLESDARGIPTGSAPVDGTAYDFTEARAIGPARLDTGYTELVRDPDGRARVRLTAGPSRGLTLWLDEAFSHLMVFTGDTLAPGARRRGLAIEPMSCAPNALAAGAGMVRLAPGDRHRAQWGMTDG